MKTTEMEDIKVVIYEDNDDLRESFSYFVKSTENFQLCGAFTNCDKVELQMKELKPDVVLMDIEMPGTNGLEGLQRLKKIYPEINVIMLTVFDDNERVFESICLGATGYLLKRTPPAKILESIADVYHGGAPMSATIARKILAMFPSGGMSKKEEYTLTKRETDILSHLVQGYSYKMIADKCFISLETVRTHIKSIYDKLHVHSMSEAVAKAIRQRIV
jgi:DNA-binding NarL/FixJ family response regulator